MNWIYLALMVSSAFGAAATAYAVDARRTATKRKRRNKDLLVRLASAEAAAALRSPSNARKKPPSQTRFANSPITPYTVATAGRSPWVSDHPDLLPAADCDLTEYNKPVTSSDEVDTANSSRRDIRVLRRRLQREFRGQPNLVLLNALTIAYLRRNTEHTAKARTLFFRIWHERADDLAPHLTPRWLLSTLRTFQEHGETDDQRLIGVGGSLYGYMLRIYESERGMSGVPDGDVYASEMPGADTFGFPGLAATSAATNDSMSHIHAVLIDLALLDDGAGRVLEELLTKSYKAPNIFARADKNRARLEGAESNAKSPHWSFYFKR